MAVDRHKKSKERAQKLVQDGDLRGALEVYQKIVAEEPNELACLTRVAELSRELGQTVDALAAYVTVAERLAHDGFFFKAAAIGRQILALDPSHTETQTRLASMYGERRIAGAATGSFSLESSRPRRRPSLDDTATAKLSDLVIDPIRTSAPPPAGFKQLPRTPLFSDMPKEALAEALSGMEVRTVAPGDRIIAEGEQGHSFFVLASGRVRVEKASPDGPLTLAILGEGAFFGEMALLQDGPRTASVVAETACDVLELDRTLLERLVENHAPVAKALQRFYQQRLLGTATATHPFFLPFTPSERRQLSERFQARPFAAGEVVIAEGKKGDGLYMLLTGVLAVHAGNPRREVARLGPGQIVGEMSLLNDQPTNAEVRAETESWVLRLGKDSFTEVVSHRPEVLAVLQRVAEDRHEGRPSAPPPRTETNEIMI